MSVKLTVENVAEAIGRPVEEWVGNCYGIATVLSEAVDRKGSPIKAALPEGRRVVYGHYLGPVEDDRAYGGPVLQHGWIDLGDGRVCDPTRWAFVGHEPFIHVGPANGEYDEGGNALRTAMLGAPPEFDPEDTMHLSVGLRTALRLQAEYGTPKPDGYLGKRQVSHLANRSPDDLGEDARDVYRALELAGRSALVPLDNWQRVMGA